MFKKEKASAWYNARTHVVYGGKGVTETIIIIIINCSTNCNSVNCLLQCHPLVGRQQRTYGPHLSISHRSIPALPCPSLPSISVSNKHKSVYSLVVGCRLVLVRIFPLTPTTLLSFITFPTSLIYPLYVVFISFSSLLESQCSKFSACIHTPPFLLTLVS